MPKIERQLFSVMTEALECLSAEQVNAEIDHILGEEHPPIPGLGSDNIRLTTNCLMASLRIQWEESLSLNTQTKLQRNNDIFQNLVESYEELHPLDKPGAAIAYAVNWMRSEEPTEFLNKVTLNKARTNFLADQIKLLCERNQIPIPEELSK